MTEIFSSASAAWSRMEAFRAQRARCKRYVYGDQWNDPICIDGRWHTEGELLSQQGQMPLKNNILRRILRNVVGLYRAQYKVPLLSAKSCGLKGRELREANAKRIRWFQENRMEELAPRLLEEFLISGLVAVKVEGRKILPVTPGNFFFHSDGYDPRGYDVDMIGETHHVSFGALLGKFCRTAEDYRRIDDIYGPMKRVPEGCLLTEVWSKEVRLLAMIHDEAAATLKLLEIPEAGIRSSLPTLRFSLFTEAEWRCRWYAPDGTLLREGESRKSHPYVFKAYPFIDGEIHSYISDIIDQQRYVNRLITLYDLIMRSSAKGVSFF